jgi:hypothetical protein
VRNHIGRALAVEPGNVEWDACSTGSKQAMPQARNLPVDSSIVHYRKKVALP